MEMMNDGGQTCHYVPQGVNQAVLRVAVAFLVNHVEQVHGDNHEDDAQTEPVLGGLEQPHTSNDDARGYGYEPVTQPQPVLVVVGVVRGACHKHKEEEEAPDVEPLVKGHQCGHQKRDVCDNKQVIKHYSLSIKNENRFLKSQTKG